MVVINIDDSAVVRHTAYLERLHRSALPKAVQVTLSRLAFDVKTDTMPKTSKVFVERSPTFLKSQSKVTPAKGFDINTMKSIVGFMPSTGAKESGGATEDLRQQEDAGSIAHRAFIPLAAARAGRSYNRRVSAKNRIAAIKNKIIDSKDSAAKTDAGKFISSAIHAGKGGLVIGTKVDKGNRMLLRINSVHRLTSDTKTKAGKEYKKGNFVVNSTPLYSVRGGRHAHIKATHFMRKASMISAGKASRIYIEEAEKQILKYR